MSTVKADPNAPQPSAPRKQFPYLFSALVVVLVGGWMVYNRIERRRQQPAPAAAKPRPVKMMAVVGPETMLYRMFPGILRAADHADLAFNVSGTLVELAVRNGQSVKKDQLLARIDPKDFQSRVDNAKADLDKAVAARDNAVVNERRSANLVKEGAIPQAEYDLVNTRLSETRAAVESAAAALEVANKALADTVLRAPAGGVVAERYVENQQNVTAHQPIFAFQGNTGMEVAINVPEQSFLHASAGDAAKIQALMAFSRRPETVVPLRFKEIATKADSSTQTFELVFSVDAAASKDLLLLPGMSADVHVRIPRKEFRNDVPGAGLYAVASDAVLPEAGNKGFVFLLTPADPDGGNVHVARKTPVTVDTASGNELILSAGVKTGDLVAVAGVRYLKDGDRVTALPWEAADAKTSASTRSAAEFDKLALVREPGTKPEPEAKGQ